MRLNLCIIALMLCAYLKGQDKKSKYSFEVQPMGNYVESGNKKYKNYDYGGAIEDYTKAIALDSTNPHVYIIYYNRALSKSKMNNYKGALEDYNKVIELDPSNTRAFNNSNLARWRMARAGGDQFDFTTSGGSNPYDSKVYAERGLMQENLKEYQWAIKEYTHAIELYSKNAGAYFGRGNCKYYLKDFKGAIEDYAKAIDLKKKYAKAYFNKGNAEYNSGDKLKACYDWKKAAKYGVKEGNDAINKFCK